MLSLMAQKSGWLYPELGRQKTGLSFRFYRKGDERRVEYRDIFDPEYSVIGIPVAFDGNIQVPAGYFPGWFFPIACGEAGFVDTIGIPAGFDDFVTFYVEVFLVQENRTFLKGSLFCIEVDFKTVGCDHVPARGHDDMPLCPCLHFFVIEMDAIGGKLFVHP